MSTLDDIRKRLKILSKMPRSDEGERDVSELLSLIERLASAATGVLNYSDHTYNAEAAKELRAVLAELEDTE